MSLKDKLSLEHIKVFGESLWENRDYSQRYFNLQGVDIDSIVQSLRWVNNGPQRHKRRNHINNRSLHSSERKRIDILIERQKKLRNQKRPLLNTDQINKKRTSFSLSEDLNLPETLLSSISSEEIIVYIDDSFFLLENFKTNKTGIPVKYKGVNFSLERLGNIKFIEGDYIKNIEDEVIRFYNENLDRLLERRRLIEKEIKKIKDAQNLSLENIITGVIFPFYKNGKMIESESVDLNIPSFDFQSIYSKLNTPFKETMLESSPRVRGIVSMGNCIYGIPKKRSLSNEIELSEIFFLEKTKSFEERYKQKLSEIIKDAIFENLSSIAGNIERCEDNLLNSKDYNVERVKDLGFEKISNNEYVVFKRLPQFIMKKNGENYLFPESKIGIRILKNKERGEIEFSQKAFIYSPRGYKHPFVYDNGSICHGSINPKKIMNISTKQKIKKLNKKELARGVLGFIEIASEVLTTGYWKDTRPVNSLSSLYRCKISKERARELHSKGVDIYDNDKKNG